MKDLRAIKFEADPDSQQTDHKRNDENLSG